MLQQIVQWCWTMQQHPAYATSSQSPKATACSSLQVRGFDRDWFEFAGEPGGTYTRPPPADGAQLDATFAAGGLKGMATFVRGLHFWQVRGRAWLLAGCTVGCLAMLCSMPSPARAVAELLRAQSPTHLPLVTRHGCRAPLTSRCWLPI